MTVLLAVKVSELEAVTALVRLKKVVVPVLRRDWLVPFIITVPELWVKVPDCVRVPLTERMPVGATNVEEALMLRSVVEALALKRAPFPATVTLPRALLPVRVPVC